MDQYQKTRPATRGTSASQRADIIFVVFHEMGPERSLAKLHLRLISLGVRVGLSTLKRYASRYGWQERLAALDVQASGRRADRSLKAAIGMHERHMQLARAVQGAGGTALQRLMQSDLRLSEMRPAEIARLLDLGIKAERDALGEATVRRDVALGRERPHARSRWPLPADQCRSRSRRASAGVRRWHRRNHRKLPGGGGPRWPLSAMSSCGMTH